MSCYFTIFFQHLTQYSCYTLHLDLTWSFHLLQKQNYSVEAQTSNYWNAGIATNHVSHGGSAKQKTEPMYNFVHWHIPFSFPPLFAYKYSTIISSVSDYSCAMISNDHILYLTARKRRATSKAVDGFPRSGSFSIWMTKLLKCRVRVRVRVGRFRTRALYKQTLIEATWR